MTEWNPVEGLAEIAYEDLRVGDEVIQLAFGHSYSRKIVESVKHLGSESKYFLLSREIHEPSGRGDLAEIYRVRPLGSESEEIDIYIRTRQKFLDETYSDSKPWTNTDNDGAFDWSQIMKFATEEPGRSIRTYTATHKEN